MQGQAGWHFWLVGFFLTLVLEAPWVLALLARPVPSWGRRFSALLFANLATHPLVWFFFPAMPLSRAWSVACSEIWAFGAEITFYALYVQGITLRRAAVTSVLANGTSFGVGWVLVSHFGAWLFRP